MKILKVLSRFYVNDMEAAIGFYEALFNRQVASRFSIPEINLEIAQLNDVLIIAGTDEVLYEYRKTSATILVDSIKDYEKFLKEKAVIIRGPSKVPTGYNMTVRHPDGVIIEYVEHVK